MMIRLFFLKDSVGVDCPYHIPTCKTKASYILVNIALTGTDGGLMTSNNSHRTISFQQVVNQVSNEDPMFSFRRAPSVVPSMFPSGVPSNVPIACCNMMNEVSSNVPRDVPSIVPVAVPSDVPRDVPSIVPIAVPSNVPSDVPSKDPSDVPSKDPSDVPSVLSRREPCLESSDNVDEVRIQGPSEVPFPTILSSAPQNF